MILLYAFCSPRELSQCLCTPYRHRFQGKAFDRQDYVHTVTTRYASVRTSGFITSTTSLSNSVPSKSTTTTLGQASECLNTPEPIVALRHICLECLTIVLSRHLLSLSSCVSENIKSSSSSLSTTCKKLRPLALAVSRMTGGRGTLSRRTVVRFQKTNLAVEMIMTETRTTMALGVGMGMSRTTRHLRARSHPRGHLGMTEAAGMKGRTTTCVVVRMRGGVADMVKTGGIPAGHDETLLGQIGGEALFVISPLHVRMFPVANKARLAQYPLHLGDDRSWEPSASWKPGGRGGDQPQRLNTSKKNPRKNGKGKKKQQQQQQKREWRADDSQLNKYVAKMACHCLDILTYLRPSSQLDPQRQWTTQSTEQSARRQAQATTVIFEGSIAIPSRLLLFETLLAWTFSIL